MFAKWFILLSAALALSVGEGGGSGASNAGVADPNLSTKGDAGGDPVGYADGAVYDVYTEEYRRVLSGLGVRLCARADCAVEAVCGRAAVRKGRLPKGV